MRKPKVVSTAVVAIGLILCSLNSLAQTNWNYSYPLDWKSNFSFDKKSGKLISGRLMLELKFCSAQEKYVCFQSSMMNFAVPKGLQTNERASWSYRGHSYDGLPLSVPFQILGQEIRVYQIDSSTQVPKMRFFYSKERGLIGFKVLGDEEKVLFLSVSACGFGAPRSCLKESKQSKGPSPTNPNKPNTDNN